MTDAPSRAPLAIGAAVAAAVAVIVAGVLVYRLWYEQEPGALAGGPGVVRLTNPERDGVPPPQRVVAGPGGAHASLALRDIDTEGGRPTADVALLPPHGDVKFLSLHQGQRTTVDGVTIQVLHIWQLPDPSHQAVDVRATITG